MYYVSDLDAAVEFYTEKLGFTLMHREEFGVAFLDADDRSGRVSLISLDAYRQAHPEEDGFPAPRLSFNVANLEEEVTNLVQKGVRVSRINSYNGKTSTATFYDLDGNAFFMWETGTGRLYEQE